MKVYIVLQEWQTDSEHQSEIMNVYSNKDSAIESLKKLYKEDLEWICDRCNCKIEDLDQNDKSDEYSFICLNEYFSENSIYEKEVLC